MPWDDNQARGSPFAEMPDFRQIWRAYGKWIITAVVVLVLGAVGYSSYYTVDANEQAVILRFGKYVRTSEPGLHFKLPFVESYEKAPVRTIFTDEFGFQTVKAGVKSESWRGESWKRRSNRC